MRAFQLMLTSSQCEAMRHCCSQDKPLSPSMRHICPDTSPSLLTGLDVHQGTCLSQGSFYYICIKIYIYIYIYIFTKDMQCSTSL